MIDLALVLALDMIRMHGLDHKWVDVNPGSIVSLRHPPRPRLGHMHETVNCLIYTADGKFLSVLEDCDTVLKLIGAAYGP